LLETKMINIIFEYKKQVWKIEINRSNLREIIICIEKQYTKLKPKKSVWDKFF